VIGGGIGGLAAAIALQQAGIKASVFERAEELREVGAGISLWANAIRALDKLGLGEAIRSFSVPSVAAALRTWQGTILMSESSTSIARKFGELCLVMHRADLQAALLDAFGHEDLYLNSECLRFRQDADGVTAEFSDGRTARGDLLIGADGLNSTVRAALHGRRKPTYSGYTAWRAVVRFDPARLLPGESWGYGARFGNVPIKGERVYWYATSNVTEGERNPGNEKAELLRIFGGWHSPIEALVDATNESDILRNDIYDRPVLSKWGDGRVTLLGDAAHPMTPNLGQGACQALEDAVLLARCMRENREVASSLRQYESERIPRTSALVKQARDIGKIGQWQNPVAVELRDAFMRYVGSHFQARQLERIIGYEI